MAVPRIRHGPVLALALWLASPAAASAQDTLAHAKELYILASYDEALVVLDRLRPSASARDSSEIAGYQVFCLLALGRTDDAKQAIEGLVKTDPLYRPSEATASPRTRAAFDDVRKGLLPAIARESYDTAKAAFDRHESEAAAAGFDRVLTLLDDPALTDREDMADLRRLAAGFRDLSKAAADTSARAKSSAEPAASSAPSPKAAAPPPPSTDPPTYAVTDVNVVPPVNVSRPMPPWYPRNAVEAHRQFRGVIELVIDEKGDVVSAVIGKSVHPTFDAPLLAAALSWKFRPATKDGVPVRYRSTVEIRLGQGS